MGAYIDNIGSTFKEKVDTLIEKHGATTTEQPKEFREDLVCVVDCISFGAAAYCRDMNDILRYSISGGRRTVWLEVPGAKNLI